MNIPILMYHQIDQVEPKGTKLRGLTVSPESFARQMALLRLYGYRGLSMRDLEPYLKGEKTGKVVGITFDDGYQNNRVHALPILLRSGFTATCYAVSSLIGGQNAWDAHLGIRQKPLMTDADWKEWHRSGMEIGSHGRTHADLPKISDELALDEISKSKIELENRFQCQIRHFCYPYGHYEDRHISMVKDAGYISATTTRRGRVHADSKPYELNRIMIARACNVIQFTMKILTSYEDKR
jgi:peptidoglycan/xylan/chitin deacetylase (PgdA/CDA1 family)